MSKLVDTVRTTPTMREFARALLFVIPELSKEAAGVLWAQFAGETGDGRFCWNWNLGNVKWTHGCGLDYVALVGVWEGFKVGDEDKDGDIDDDDRAMLVARMVASGLWVEDKDAGHAVAVGKSKVSLIATKSNTAAWFRAYSTLDQAMAAYVGGKRSGRFASAWAFVEAGDCDGFAKDIGIPRIRGEDKFPTAYYTADVGAYSRAMQAKHKAWMSSSAYEEALGDLTPTLPSIVTAAQLLPEAPLVRPRVPLPEREDPEF